MNKFRTMTDAELHAIAARLRAIKAWGATDLYYATQELQRRDIIRLHAEIADGQSYDPAAHTFPR